MAQKGIPQDKVKAVIRLLQGREGVRESDRLKVWRVENDRLDEIEDAVSRYEGDIPLMDFAKILTDAARQTDDDEFMDGVFEVLQQKLFGEPPQVEGVVPVKSPQVEGVVPVKSRPVEGEMPEEGLQTSFFKVSEIPSAVKNIYKSPDGSVSENYTAILGPVMDKARNPSNMVSRKDLARYIVKVEQERGLTFLDLPPDVREIHLNLQLMPDEKKTDAGTGTAVDYSKGDTHDTRKPAPDDGVPASDGTGDPWNLDDLADSVPVDDVAPSAAEDEGDDTKDSIGPDVPANGKAEPVAAKPVAKQDGVPAPVYVGASSAVEGDVDEDEQDNGVPSADLEVGAGYILAEAQQEVEDLQDRVLTYEKMVSGLQDDAMKNKAAREEAERTVKELQDKVLPYEKAVSALQDDAMKNKGLQGKLNEAKKDLAKTQKDLTDAKTHAAAVEQGNEELSGRIDELIKEKEKLTRQVKDVNAKAEIAKTKAEDLDRVVNSVKDSYASLDRLLRADGKSHLPFEYKFPTTNWVILFDKDGKVEDVSKELLDQKITDLAEVFPEAIRDKGLNKVNAYIAGGKKKGDQEFSMKDADGVKYVYTLRQDDWGNFMLELTTVYGETTREIEFPDDQLGVLFGSAYKDIEKIIKQSKDDAAKMGGSVENLTAQLEKGLPDEKRIAFGFLTWDDHADKKNAIYVIDKLDGKIMHRSFGADENAVHILDAISANLQGNYENARAHAIATGNKQSFTDDGTVSKYGDHWMKVQIGNYVDDSSNVTVDITAAMAEDAKRIYQLLPERVTYFLEMEREHLDEVIKTTDYREMKERTAGLVNDLNSAHDDLDEIAKEVEQEKQTLRQNKKAEIAQINEKHEKIRKDQDQVREALEKNHKAKITEWKDELEKQEYDRQKLDVQVGELQNSLKVEQNSLKAEQNSLKAEVDARQRERIGLEQKVVTANGILTKKDGELTTALGTVHVLRDSLAQRSRETDEAQATTRRAQRYGVLKTLAAGAIIGAGILGATYTDLIEDKVRGYFTDRGVQTAPAEPTPKPVKSSKDILKTYFWEHPLEKNAHYGNFGEFHKTVAKEARVAPEDVTRYFNRGGGIPYMALSPEKRKDIKVYRRNGQLFFQHSDVK